MATEIESYIDRLNLKMLGEVKKKGFLTNRLYSRAFEKVKRHLFISTLYEVEDNKFKRNKLDYDDPDKEILEKIYVDIPLGISVKNNDVDSTSSQPTVMAMMIEAAELKKDFKVLEVGSGSGYNAAVISEVCGAQSKVVTLEKDTNTFVCACESLKRAGYGDIKIFKKDGGFGEVGNAPYNSIIVTCACTDISFSWNKQLVDNGTLILPLATRGTETLMKLKKIRENLFEGKFLYFVRFLRMSGSSSMITHYHFDSKTFTSLRNMVHDDAKIDEEFSKELEKELQKREYFDFIFYISVVDDLTISFHDEEEDGLGAGYGLWNKKMGESGFAFMFSKKVYYHGNRDILERLKKRYKEFLKLRKPKLKDYSIIVIPINEQTISGPNRWSVKRRITNTIITLKK